MRVMMRAAIPVEQGNKALKDGTFRKVVQSALQELKPEAAYFFPSGASAPRSPSSISRIHRRSR